MLPNICHFCGRFSISKNLLWMFGNFWFRKLCGHWNRKVWITVEKLNGSMSSRFVHFPPISTEITTFSIDTLWFYHLIITFIIKWSTTKEIWAVQEHCILPVANGNGWNSSHQPTDHISYIAYAGSFKYFSVQLFHMYFATRPSPSLTAVQPRTIF